MPDLLTHPIGGKTVMKRYSDPRYQNFGKLITVHRNEILSQHVIDIPRILTFSREGVRKSDSDYYLEAVQ